MNEPNDPFKGGPPMDWSGFYDMFVGMVAAGFTEDQALTLIAKMISSFKPGGPPEGS